MVRLRSTLSAVALCAAAFGVVSTARGTQILYGLSSNPVGPGTLFTLNTTTGADTVVANLSGNIGTDLVGLGTIGSTLYASDVFAGGQYTFGTINTTTGAYSVLSNQNGSSVVSGLAYNGLTGAGAGFYADDALHSQLILLNATTGATTVLASEATQFADLAYNGTTLYGIDAAGNLDTINTTTGALNVIAALKLSGVSLGTSAFYGMSFDSNGTLYVNTGNFGSDPNDLFTVNTGTAALTLIGSNGTINGIGIDGIAFSPSSLPASVPEPMTVVLAGVALPALGVWAIRRRPRKEYM